jgi:ABC-type transport system involved in multi-copper enzyme maturation permease subunit
MKWNRQTKSAVFATLGYTAALELMLAAAILYWPAFRENTGALKALAGPIPMLKDMIVQLEDKGSVAYVLSQHFFKGCNVLGVAAATLFAVGAVAGEAHRGTLEIFLMRPVSRCRLLTERFLTGALQVVLPIFLTTLTIPLLLARVDEVGSLGNYMLAAIHQCLFLLCLFSLAFFLSTLGRTPLKLAFGVLIFAIFNFSMYMVKTVTHYSLFRLADIQTFLDVYENGPSWALWGGFVATIVVLFGASLFVFERRVP